MKLMQLFFIVIDFCVSISYLFFLNEIEGRSSGVMVFNVAYSFDSQGQISVL